MGDEVVAAAGAPPALGGATSGTADGRVDADGLGSCAGDGCAGDGFTLAEAAVGEAKLNGEVDGKDAAAGAAELPKEDGAPGVKGEFAGAFLIVASFGAKRLKAGAAAAGAEAAGAAGVSAVAVAAFGAAGAAGANSGLEAVELGLVVLPSAAAMPPKASGLEAGAADA